MRSPFQEFADRIRSETRDLERLAQKVEQTWIHIHTVAEDQDVYLDSVARRAYPKIIKSVFKQLTPALSDEN